MKDILELIATYGLPIVLTVWFVFRIDTVITKLVHLLEDFITWQKEREEDRKEREKEMKSAVKTLTEQTADTVNRIKILEVRLSK